MFRTVFALIVIASLTLVIQPKIAMGSNYSCSQHFSDVPLAPFGGLIGDLDVSQKRLTYAKSDPGAILKNLGTFLDSASASQIQALANLFGDEGVVGNYSFFQMLGYILNSDAELSARFRGNLEYNKPISSQDMDRFLVKIIRALRWIYLEKDQTTIEDIGRYVSLEDSLSVRSKNMKAFHDAVDEQAFDRLLSEVIMLSMFSENFLSAKTLSRGKGLFFGSLFKRFDEFDSAKLTRNQGRAFSYFFLPFMHSLAGIVIAGGSLIISPELLAVLAGYGASQVIPGSPLRLFFHGIRNSIKKSYSRRVARRIRRSLLAGQITVTGLEAVKKLDAKYEPPVIAYDQRIAADLVKSQADQVLESNGDQVVMLNELIDKVNNELEVILYAFLLEDADFLKIEAEIQKVVAGKKSKYLENSESRKTAKEIIASKVKSLESELARLAEFQRALEEIVEYITLKFNDSKVYDPLKELRNTLEQIKIVRGQKTDFVQRLSSYITFLGYENFQRLRDSLRGVSDKPVSRRDTLGQQVAEAVLQLEAKSVSVSAKGFSDTQINGNLTAVQFKGIEVDRIPVYNRDREDIVEFYTFLCQRLGEKYGRELKQFVSFTSNEMTRGMAADIREYLPEESKAKVLSLSNENVPIDILDQLICR